MSPRLIDEYTNQHRQCDEVHVALDDTDTESDEQDHTPWGADPCDVVANLEGQHGQSI